MWLPGEIPKSCSSYVFFKEWSSYNMPGKSDFLGLGKGQQSMNRPQAAIPPSFSIILCLRAIPNGALWWLLEVPTDKNKNWTRASDLQHKLINFILSLCPPFILVLHLGHLFLLSINHVYFILFCLLSFLSPHLVVLKLYFWLCTQAIIPRRARGGGSYGMPDIEPRWVTCKASSLPAVLSLKLQLYHVLNK